MNRRALLAGAAALALAMHPAAAQMAVHDAPSNLLRVAEAARALQEAIRQYRMLEATWTALSGARDVRGVAAALGGPVRTWMPEAGMVADLFNGSAGTLWGAADWLQRAARYADVGQDTPWAREHQRREAVTANAKAIAMAGLESAQASILNLSSLLDRVSGSEDVNDAAAVNGALEVENQNLAHHRAQLDQIRLMLAAEDRTERQRAEQMQWESARQLFESTRPFGGLQ